MNGRVVTRASMQIMWGVQISEGQIIRAILYTKTLFYWKHGSHIFRLTNFPDFPVSFFTFQYFFGV